MLTFKPVRCPECGGVVMEIATGLARGRCRNRDCRRKPRIQAASDGREVWVSYVDSAPKKLVAV